MTIIFLLKAFGTEALLLIILSALHCLALSHKHKQMAKCACMAMMMTSLFMLGTYLIFVLISVRKLMPIIIDLLK